MTETAAETLEEQLAGYADDPVGFAGDVLNLKIDDWQKRFLEAVREHNKIAVRSSTGQGKDFIGAVAILWFLASYEKSYCPCSANSEAQLEKVLWKQFAELINGANGFDTVFEWQATAIRHRAFPAEWLAFAKTSNKRITAGGESHAEGSAGHHADNMLILLDEASGIEEVYWQAYEPTLTGPNNKIIAIGNPNRLSGSFYQIWYKSTVAGFWNRFTIAGRDNAKARASASAGDRFHVSERGNQSGNHDYLIAKWGVNHPIVQSKVFGVHPTTTTERVGYAFEEIMAARSRRIEPAEFDRVQIGVDASCGGRDRTPYVIRRGRKFRMIVDRPQSVHAIVDRILAIADEEPDPTQEKMNYQPLVVVDDGGLIDLSGWLKKAGYKNVRSMHFGSAARDKKLFYNIAAEMWLEDLKSYFDCTACGRSFEAHFDDVDPGSERIPCPAYLPGIDFSGAEYQGEEGDELMNQLITRQWFFTGKEKIQRALQSKDDIRKEGGRSPDHADGHCLAVVRPRMPGVF